MPGLPSHLTQHSPLALLTWLSLFWGWGYPPVGTKSAIGGSDTVTPLGVACFKCKYRPVTVVSINLFLILS
jgi:hypothetical protein